MSGHQVFMILCKIIASVFKTCGLLVQMLLLEACLSWLTECMFILCSRALMCAAASSFCGFKPRKFPGSSNHWRQRVFERHCLTVRFFTFADSVTDPKTQSLGRCTCLIPTIPSH